MQGKAILTASKPKIFQVLRRLRKQERRKQGQTGKEEFETSRKMRAMRTGTD